MTVIVADCGSTKSDWRIKGSDGHVVPFKGDGINAALDSRDELVRKFMQLKPFVGDGRVVLYFYGAGVVSKEVSDAVGDAFSEIFPCSSCEARSDMEGAVRSLLGDGDGIAAILGTGSNSAFCKEGRIVCSVPSGGYVLGDEGSGAWIGKALLSDYVKSLMPEDVSKEFERAYGLDYPGIVKAVYALAFPNRFIAGFAVFAGAFKTHPYIKNILANGFDSFFARNIMQYGQAGKCFLGLTGSVAWNFSEYVREAAVRAGLRVDKITSSPIEALAEYHFSHYV